MQLVIDANIIISALIASQGKTADLVFSNKLTLIAPEYLGVEIKRYKEEICRKAGYSSEDF